MTLLIAAFIAFLAFFIGAAHSAIGERNILGPLFAEGQTGILKPRATKAILRAVWHLPSVTWALMGVAVLLARIQGGIALISFVAAALFTVSGVANLLALRRPFFGGILLVATAGLTIFEWQINP